METLQLYWAYLGLYLKSRREYRFSFLMGILDNFYKYFLVYATLWVITEAFDELAGWSFNEISILYSLHLFTYALACTVFWGPVFHLEGLVINGDFDRYLLRPQGLIPQLVCQRFTHTSLGQIVVALIFLITSLTRATVGFSAWKWAYLVVAVVGGVLIQAGAMIIIGALSFWVQRSEQIGRIFWNSFREFINYPLEVFPGIVKFTLTYILPWAFINYYPTLILLDKAGNTLNAVLGYFTPVVGIGFFLLSLWIFRIGVRRYTSVGN